MEEKESQPLCGQGPDGDDQSREDPRMPLDAGQEESGDAIEIYDLLAEIDQDRVRPDDDEEECPAAPAFDVDEPIEQGQEKQGPAAAPEDVRARPDVFDDGKGQPPDMADGQADDARGGEPQGLRPSAPFRFQPV